MREGKLYVLSGPSGVGKDTVLAALQVRVPELSVCITATTRSMRPGESQGNPYQFLSVAEFETLVREDAFLEYARVNGNNLYGTPRAWVVAQRALGKDVLLKIDVQGGLTVREKMPDAILVFLEPPSMEELERRLRARSTEDEDAIRIRLMDARSELAQRPRYDYAVFNDTVEAAAEKLKAILIAEACRIPHH
ncbi:MAG: guanylate kinase [Armatimonas sp.]